MILSSQTKLGYNCRMAKFYITTAIPYVNAAPHVGHALEFIQADVIARYHRLLGGDVLLLSGADENALKNVQAAQKANMPIQDFIDANAVLFQNLADRLNIRFSIFQKGSDHVHHYPSSQKLWKLCFDNGDIYKKSYEGLYCVGCEAFYTTEELNENGECAEHPGKKLDKISEENYFFRLSKYEHELKNLISQNIITIIPENRKREVLSFLDNGLNDISISRTNDRAKNWGVPIPEDPAQRMYVWFDALNIYQSGIGFGWDEALYRKWWPADVHVIGKGITRFHAIYWPAFLLSAKLPIPKSIFVHEYFTVNGQKMSKTLGNVVDPIRLVETYGSDPLRYYFLAKFSPFHDGDFSEAEFKKIFNADLANGLGNLVSRVAKLAHTFNVQRSTFNFLNVHTGVYKKALEEYRFNDALAYVWEKVKHTDKYIDTNEPWKMSGEKLQIFLDQAVDEIREIATLLEPFLPETSEKILEQFRGPTITSLPPLFPRLS